MGCEANTPSFKYVLVENLVITYNSIPYAIKTMYTKKKYIIWNVNRPYQLEDSDVRPDESLIEYLIVINDNGIPTILNHDGITLSFDSKTNGSNGTGTGDYVALKNKVNENTNKYNIISQTVDGMEQIIGETSALEDGTIVYNLNKVKSDSKSYGIKIGEIQTKIDDKYKELRPILLNDLVEYLKSVSEYKLSFTNLAEDTEIISDELILINTNKINMNDKLTILQGNLDKLKLILDDINDTTKSQLVSDAKTQLTNLNDSLINLCDTALLNNKIDGNEKSNIIQKSYELANYIGVVQNTCNNITVNGLGGVIYSVQNELLMLKDSTKNTITELSRKDEDLYHKYSTVLQNTSSIVEEVGELKNQIGDINSTSKKNVRSVVTQFCLSSSSKELIGTNFANIQKGDLIFFGNSNNGRYKGVYHVGIYYGNDETGVPRILECTGNNIVKLHSDGKTMAITLSSWESRQKYNIVCIARPTSTTSNRVFTKADEFVSFAKTYYDKRSQYITYGNINVMSDNFTRSWLETTIKGADSPDGLYRFLDCSTFLNMVIRGIPFEEVFANEIVYKSKNLNKRSTYTWTTELPRYASEQCEEVESLGWALPESEWHSDGGQWSTSVPDNPNNYYIWSKNVTTYTDGTVKDSEVTCISNDQAQHGKSIIDITPYYYESTSSTDTIGGAWSTISPRWTSDKYVWSKNLILYDDDTTSWTNAICVSGTSPMILTLDASSYVVAFDSYNIPKSVENITLTATQTNFNDTVNWFVNPNTVLLGGSGNIRTISPNQFNDLDKITVTVQSKGLNNTIAIVKVKDGKKGEDGTSVRILGQYNTEEELKLAHPSGNENGDGYIVGLDLWIWNGTEFTNVGQFKGDNGQDGATPIMHIKYSNDGGLTFTPNNGEDVGDYIGICVNYEETDPATTVSYQWSQFKGDRGDKGDDGVGVESIVIEYAKNKDKVVAPTTGWSTSIPQYAKDYYLWYRTRTKYTNNSNYVYSTPTCDESWKSIGDLINIIGDWSYTETISESFSKVTKTVDSIKQEVKRNSRVSSFRYLRDYINGNTVNSGTHIVEIQIFKNGTNVALNKTVTCSGTGSNLSYAVNGNTTSSQYAEVSGGTLVREDDLNGFKYIQIDLGEVISNIEKIKVWHYYSDGRSYYHKLEVSKDGDEWFRFFDSEKTGLYNESSKGKTYIIDDTYSESQFEQTANKFNWFIKSGTSSSTMVLTDDFYSVLTENIRLTAKNININGLTNIQGLTTINGKFKVLTDGSIEATDGKFSGAINGGSININNSFKVANDGSFESTKANISGTVNITGGSINLNNGLFMVLSNGNTRIGGNTPNTVEGYVRAQLEITSNGTIFSVSPNLSNVYTKISEGTIKVVSPNCTLTMDDAFQSNGDVVLRSSLNSVVDGAGGVVVLCCNGATKNDTDSRVIKHFKNSSGDYVFRSNSTSGVIYNGTSSYPWKQVAAKEFNNTSDRSLKENIKYITNSQINLPSDIKAEDLYDFVKNDLPIAIYNYIGDESLKIGFVAQDIIYNPDESDNVVGQLIVNPKGYTSEDGKLTYDLNNYVSVLVGALQILIKKVEILEGIINGN